MHDKLTAAGCAVLGYDCQGHGASEPLQLEQRCNFLSYKHVLEDAQQHLRESVVTWYKQHAAGRQVPLFYAGFSMGANTAVNMAGQGTEGLPKPAGLLLVSVVVYLVYSRLWTPVIRALRWTAPRLKLTPIEVRELSVRQCAAASHTKLRALHCSGLEGWLL